MKIRGKKILEYKIIKSLGKEGNVFLYSAIDQKKQKSVNLKTLDLNDIERSNLKQVIENIENRIETIKKFDNSNIQKILDFGMKDDKYFVVSEMVEGNTLADLMDKIKNLPLTKILDLALNLCLIVIYSHNKSILHQDIRPGNIIIDIDNVRLINFAIYRSENQSQSFYLAPEIIIGSSEYNIKSEIYSLGIIMYQMFTGKLPFEGKSHADIINKILNQDIPSMNTYKSSIPDALDRIILKALKRRSDQRYDSVQELYSALNDIKGFYQRI